MLGREDDDFEDKEPEKIEDDLDEDDLEDENLEKLDDHLDDEEEAEDEEELKDEEALEDDPWEKQVRMYKSKGSKKDNLW